MTNEIKKFNTRSAKNFFLDHIIEVLLIVLVTVMALASHTFFTWANWTNIFRNMSMKGVIAFGMTMVIIAGQIDLSIGSTVALSGVIIARCCRDMPDALGVSLSIACIIGILISLIAAIAMGFLHGYAQHKFGMPSFIITLASLNLLYGIAGMISGGFPIANEFPDWYNKIGTGKIGGPHGLPIPMIILLVVFCIFFFIMNYTTTGRSIYAVGGNPESARLSGINVLLTKIIVFASVQCMCVVAGMINSAQVMAGSYSFGKGWEVDVISAVVIGGTSMLGGVGKVWGTLIGIIFLGVIVNGMTILNLNIYAQFVVRAVLMFFAVMVATSRAKAKA